MREFLTFIILLFSVAGLSGNPGRYFTPRVSKGKITCKLFDTSLKIVAKITVFDNIQSTGRVLCEEYSSNINSGESCILQNGGKRFIKKQCEYFTSRGKLRFVDVYKAMGPLRYSIQDLYKDTALMNLLKVSEETSFKIDLENNLIIDRSDSMMVCDVWESRRLAFAYRKVNKTLPINEGLMIAYRYEN